MIDFLRVVVSENAEKDKKTEELEEKVSTIESQILLQERSSAQNTLTFQNFPLFR